MEASEEGGAPPQSPPKPPQVGEGQDVLARWTDGLLYLGVVKKVDAPRRGCLIQFEDNSQFFVLWKDISPAAEPGDDPACCVCAGSARNPDNCLVRCGKCGHAYHQRCHAPPAPGGAAPWSCRRCVFAVATKRGGALRRGPQARAMLRMKSVLPYALGALDWDPPHLHNLQHCYCYCGGPGQFYIFECSVCRGGAESVRRLPLRWVDVAHLLLYHLSVCCKRKYFDLESEILPFANAHWGALRLGTLSATPRSQRYRRLLGALSTHKDRFVSGREMKKRRGLFGLQDRAPPPLPPELLPRPSPTRGEPSPSAGRGRGGTRRRPLPQRSQAPPGGSYNFRHSPARAPPSAPIRMFASFHPAGSPSSPRPDPEPEAPPPAQAPPPSLTPPPVQAPPPRVLARRVTLDGTVQYLLEWGGGALL